VKIVIAAWHLRDYNVGLGRYCRGLIDAIGRVDRENHYEILTPDNSCRFPDRSNIQIRVMRFPLFKRRFWEQMASLLVGSHDLLHFPYDSCVAWKRGKFITTIHDVKPLLFDAVRSRPSIHQAVERLLVRNPLARIDHVLTDSLSSRQDIAKHLGIPEDRLTVVYPGIDLQEFRPASSDEATEKNRRPYVLCVAGSDPTKNVGALVEAFGNLPASLRQAHHLVLVGDFRRRGDLRERVRLVGIEKHTIFSGIVSDERLVELYQHAAVFVFPSLYEGFGLPVLEAMACGCPVISSDASSLPEVAGDAAILVNPTDVRQLTAEMERVLTDAGLRRALRERGLVQAARFSWDRTARETIAVYRKVLSQR
jgi:glycosyltransferase involved in cell wall biosynthesis